MPLPDRRQVERRDSCFREARGGRRQRIGLVVDRDIRGDVAPDRVEHRHGMSLHDDVRRLGLGALLVVGALVGAGRGKADVGVRQGKRAVVDLERVDQAGMLPRGGQLRAVFIVQVVAIRQNAGNASGRDVVRPPEASRDCDGCRQGARDTTYRRQHLRELLRGVGGDDDPAAAARREHGGRRIGEGLADAGLRIDARQSRIGRDEPFDTPSDRVLRLARRRRDRPQQLDAVHADSLGESFRIVFEALEGVPENGTFAVETKCMVRDAQRAGRLEVPVANGQTKIVRGAEIALAG